MTVTNANIASWRQVGINQRGRSITYRQFTTVTENLKTGDTAPTFTNSTIDLVLTSPIKSGQTAERRFRILTSDLPETPPNKRSRIIYNSKEYLIQRYESDQSETVYDIYCVRA